MTTPSRFELIRVIHCASPETAQVLSDAINRATGAAVLMSGGELRFVGNRCISRSLLDAIARRAQADVVSMEA